MRWSAVRTLVGGNQFAEHRNGSHQDEAAEPNDCDRLVRMAQCLPSPGPERMTNAVVALHRDGDQSPGRHGYRGGCKKVVRNRIRRGGGEGSPRGSNNIWILFRAFSLARSQKLL